MNTQLQKKENNTDLTFQPTAENVELVKQTVAKAMEIVGGQSYFRSSELERLFRDVQAAHFHPLPEKDQPDKVIQR